MNAKEVLKQYFGYDTYNPGQEEIIEAILSGRDVLAVMPTGSGKSVCYQVPAMILEGITIVISPLISLMQDQVKALNDAGISAGYINSSLTDAQIAKVYRNALEGRYKILYVAPERLESYDFIGFTEDVTISMVTVDEAHCISEWGQDFRPSYLRIVDLIRRLEARGVRPIVSAFTATATEEVKTDIACVLNLKNPKLVSTGFDRENLYFVVESTKKKEDYILDYVRSHADESGIIYCATRKHVDTLYDLLLREGFAAVRYHAGMGSIDRRDSQNDFIYDRAPICVATNAFGMGINKSNVRYVIHYNMPQSMENYYQEAGRAGRDGERAQCILLFSAQDVIIDKFLLAHKEFTDIDPEDQELIKQRDARRLQIMEGYCKTTKCLRNYILDYFGEKRNEPCDNCGNCHRTFSEIDRTEEAKQIINCVYETRGRYGLNIVIGTLMGANRARLKELGTTGYRTYGVLKERSEAELRELISQMILDGYLIQTEEQYSVLKMGNIAPLKQPGARVMIRTFEEKETEGTRSRSRSRDRGHKTDALTRAGYELFDLLRSLRKTIAEEEGLPPYIVFNDRTLIDMSAKAPGSREEMLNVSGVGNRKYEKYGERFLETIAGYLESHPGVVTGILEKEAPRKQSGFGFETISDVTDVISSEESRENPLEEFDENTLDGSFEASESESSETIVKETKKSRRRSKKIKGPFYLNPEDGEKFEYRDLYYITDLRDELNRVTSAENVKKLYGTDIFRFLTEIGYVEEKRIDGKLCQLQTSYGLAKGIESVERTSAAGTVYSVLMYPPIVQREIVDHFILLGQQIAEDGAPRPGNEKQVFEDADQSVEDDSEE